MPLAVAAKPLKRLKTAMGGYCKKVGMDLGLAPLPLGFGATSAWDRAASSLSGLANGADFR
jgi:hypothetical protein